MWICKKSVDDFENSDLRIRCRSEADVKELIDLVDLRTVHCNFRNLLVGKADWRRRWTYDLVVDRSIDTGGWYSFEVRIIM